MQDAFGFGLLEREHTGVRLNGVHSLQMIIRTFNVMSMSEDGMLEQFETGVCMEPWSDASRFQQLCWIWARGFGRNLKSSIQEGRDYERESNL